MSRLTTLMSTRVPEMDCADTVNGITLVPYDECLARPHCEGCPANIHIFIPVQLEKLNE